MPLEHSEFDERVKKLELLRAAGINPYPERFERTHTVSEARKIGEKGVRTTEDVIKDTKKSMQLCGRLMSWRSHGKLSFGQLQDFSGRIQICLMRDVVGEKSYKFFQKHIDVADFLGLSGELFVTQHGELTLMIKEYVLLGKTLRPLPEKWHGIQDVEARYRYRYLDLVMNQESTKRFLLRTKMVKLIRDFLDHHGFLEVDTPVLSPKASGAFAKPFITHHETLDKDYYLRIAPETYLKRLIVGGFERVYEFARCFRNEGIDPSHHQEFTMLEYYAAYWNYKDNMRFTEELFAHFIKQLFGSLETFYRGMRIDWTPPWPRKSLRQVILEDSGIDIDESRSAEELRNRIKQKKIPVSDVPHFDHLGRGNLIDALYKKVSRPKLIQPTFILEYPLDLSPLARRNDKNPDLTDRFQLVVNTWEVVNAYSELVDPVDQRKRLEEQAKLKAKGDVEAMEMDEDYLVAMEHGMPPVSGWGMGIDRMVALLTEQENLKDVIFFPLMKPLE